MMIDARELDDGTKLSAAICIVGAGAAGIALALQFLAEGVPVLLLESGGEGFEDDTQALYDGEVADERLHAPPITYRQRRFGGSTAIWGGRCMPFDAIDFERRDWIPDSGWPFGLDTLLRYYPEANRICEAGDFSYTAAAAFPRGLRPMIAGFAGTRFSDDTLERFSCPTDFARRYRHRLAISRDVRVVLHANVTNISMSDDGARVAGVEARTLGGKSLSVGAGCVVLATGGLEVPRLLLASRDAHAEGIGNAHDLVGRYYMCHIAGTLGEISFSRGGASVWHGYDIADDGVYCRRRFALTASAQRDLRVGNFVARLHHPRIPDPSHQTGVLSALFLARPFIGYEYAKRLHGDATPGLRGWLGHVRNILLDPWNTGVFLSHWLRRRTLADRKFPSIIVRSKTGKFSLDVHAEQVPNRDSRVCLTATRDALGLPRPRVDWRPSAADIATVRVAVRALAEDLATSGCGTLRFDDDRIEADLLRDGAYGGHHIGTARMAASPRRGVVDADCRVHGVENLYIAGSAVFPTSSQANPTLTIVAMALRLAERLKQVGHAVP